MTIRAKFHCEGVREWDPDHEGTIHGATVSMRPVYGDSEENKRWSKATPSGSVMMNITNMDALVQFTPGKDYYLDFIPCDPAEADASDQLGLGEEKPIPGVDELLGDGERIDKPEDAGTEFPAGSLQAAATEQPALGLATEGAPKSDTAAAGDGGAPLAAVAEPVKDPGDPAPVEDTAEEKAAKDAAAEAVKRAAPAVEPEAE